MEDGSEIEASCSSRLHLDFNSTSSRLHLDFNSPLTRLQLDFNSTSTRLFHLDFNSPSTRLQLDSNSTPTRLQLDFISTSTRFYLASIFQLAISPFRITRWNMGKQTATIFIPSPYLLTYIYSLHVYCLNIAYIACNILLTYIIYYRYL